MKSRTPLDLELAMGIGRRERSWSRARQENAGISEMTFEIDDSKFGKYTTAHESRVESGGIVSYIPVSQK